LLVIPYLEQHLHPPPAIFQISIADKNELGKKAKGILSATFWKNGWLDAGCRQTSTEDFPYAKARRLMFDLLTIPHDALIRRIVDLRQSIPSDKAAKAFLASCCRNLRNVSVRVIFRHYLIEERCVFPCRNQ